MKLLLDMNIPVEWESFLTDAGWPSQHLCRIGERPVTDYDVLRYTAEQGCVLFTHDLGMGAVLEHAGQNGPSVFQVIASDLMVPQVGASVVRTLRECQPVLEDGAFVLVDMETGRARVVRYQGGGDPGKS